METIGLRSSLQVDSESAPERIRRLIWFPSSKPILDTKSAFGMFPLYGTIDAGNHAGAAFQTPGKFDGHLSFFAEGVKVCRTGINTESFFTGVTDFLIKGDVAFFVVFKGIEGQLFGDLHRRRPSFIISFTSEALGSP